MNEMKKGVTIAAILIIASASGLFVVTTKNFITDTEKDSISISTSTGTIKAVKKLEPDRRIIEKYQNKKDLTYNTNDVEKGKSKATEEKETVQNMNLPDEKPVSYLPGNKKDSDSEYRYELIEREKEITSKFRKKENNILSVGSGDVSVSVPKIDDENKPKDNGDLNLNKVCMLFERCPVNLRENKPIYLTDIMRENSSWVWEEKWKIIDNNSDNNPEYIWYWARGVYKEDNNNDGKPEYKAILEREVTAYNNDNDKKIDIAFGWQKGQEFADPNSDEKIEYECAGELNAYIKGIMDKHVDYLSASIVGYQRLDNNTNGNYEFVRNISSTLTLQNTLTNKSTNGKLTVYQCYDECDDTTIEYHGILIVSIDVKNANANLSVCVYEIYDKNLDGNAEWQRGFWLGAVKSGTACATHFEGFAAVDSNSNGNPEHLAMLIISYDKKDTNKSAVVWGYECIDYNEDNNPEIQNCTTIVAHKDSQYALVNATFLSLGDANSNGVFDSGKLLVLVYMREDVNSDNNPEKERVTLVGYEFADWNEDSNKEIERVLLAGAISNDTNSNGFFEERKALIIYVELLDNSSDGVPETKTALAIGYEKLDSSDDGNAEFEHVCVKGAQNIDMNQNGNLEVKKVLVGEIKCYDNNTNGVQELKLAYLVYYEAQDYDDNGTANYEHIRVVLYKGEDTNEDGTIDIESIFILEKTVHKP